MALIRVCTDEAAYLRARQVIEDYSAWLAIDLSFQGLAAELAELPRMYGAPAGALLLAEEEGTALGCVGVRRLDRSCCEMKRLFVYPQFTGQGLGRELCVRLIALAGELGYQRMRLDTIARLASANRLYERLGFREIPAYCANPDPTVRYLELELGAAAAG